MTHIIPTYRRWPVTFVSGRGSIVVDDAGRSYLDLVAGIAVAGVGHCHPRVVEAIARQAGRLVHVSNLYATRPQEDLADRLAALTGGKLAFFGNSGAEAIECALKLARKRGREAGPHKTRIVAANGGFHGRTYGALSATGQPQKRAAFEPVVPGFTHVAFGDASALAGAMGDDVAAVLLEPIQGEAGVIIPPDDYFESVRQTCDEWGALLIADEIQTGLGRTGRWFGYEHWGAVPDVMCLAKALAGGLPMGACLASPEVASSLQIGDHASTFGGGPVQSAAALATLEVIDREALVERAEKLGESLVRALRDSLVGAREVRGKGLLVGIELEAERSRLVAEKALDAGVLVNDATPSVVRLCPPLVISEEEIERAVETLARATREVMT